MRHTNNPALLAVREAVTAAFSDTWLFQRGAAPRQTAEGSCRYARDLLARVHIDDPNVRSRLDSILCGCEAAIEAIRNELGQGSSETDEAIRRTGC